ncbi:MAG: UDP-N-acetylmuramoyl-L-alanine--D-glutamate ligase [Clostridia bacterium]|nr:UDP-N-acetylmuramoyl-L-alanine--D-glutamate ligase [Clostridia bacterium]
MDSKTFFEQVKGKRIAFCGAGVSNTPLVYRFLEKGAKVFVCDRRTREQIGPIADEFEKKGAVLRLGAGYLENLEVDMIFRTPGMSFNMPELIRARENGICVTSEMEVFFELCPASIFAITGSDGKTTTTTLIAKMLEAEGKKVHIGGNIGEPLLHRVDEISPNDYVVVELSSFQLISMRKSPDVAVVTNLAPNHLDIHKDMDEYIDAKKNIFLHQNAFSRTVLNADNEITNGFASQVRGQLMKFSMTTPVRNGAWLDSDGTLNISYRGITAPVITRDEIAIVGDHNVENYLAAIAAVWGYAGIDSIARVAREFMGVAHRIELIREKNGVKFYNDSIASSPTRTIAALKALPKGILLIAGGYDKHIPFEPLAPYVCDKVRTLLLCGPTADKIEKAVKEYEGFDPEKTEIVRVEDIAEAVTVADKMAKLGESVLLSPACASFDAYPNFVARGNHFKELVNKL